jgi:hypothetical protein
LSLAYALTESYLRRTGKPRDGLDAHYQYQWTVLRDLLSRLEVILDDEGIDREQAERILRCLLYGSPSVADAEDRIEITERLKEALSREPPASFLFPDGLGLPPG